MLVKRSTSPDRRIHAKAARLRTETPCEAKRDPVVSCRWTAKPYPTDPNVVDRLIQQAILQVLTPIFDPGFSESSFGFRPGRLAQGAAKQVQAHIRAGYRHCVDMDLSKFFDRVQHDVLMVWVSRKVSDKRLLALIGRYLRTGRHGRHRTAAIDRRHDARRSSFATAGEYPAG